MSGLRVAWGEIDITPRFPVDLAGYGARVNPSLGVLDPIFATFLLFEGEEKRALLISFDLLAVGKGLRARIYPLLHKLGFSKEEIFLVATHTHSAPSTGAVPYMGKPSELWLEDVAQGIYSLLSRAVGEARYRTLKIGKGEVEIALNRRTLEGWLPEKKQEGYVEKEMALFLLDEMPLVNFTCHAVCLTERNRFVSADFPGRTRMYLKYFLNTPAVLMVNGAGGDQNPIERDIYGLENMGRALAEATLSVVKKVEGLEGEEINYVHKVTTFPLARAPSIPELEMFIDQQKEGMSDVSLQEKIVRQSYIRWAEDTMEKLKRGSCEKKVEGKISLLRIGEAVFVFLPGEVFSEIGREAREMIREKGSFPFIVGYYDELVGYLPTASAFEEGGYEVYDAYRWYGKPAPFLPIVEDIVLESIKELLEKI